VGLLITHFVYVYIWQSKSTKCATPRCEQTFTQKWLTNWGFNQISMLLNNSKIEWANKSLTSATTSFVETLPPMLNCKLSFNASLNLLLKALNL